MKKKGRDGSNPNPYTDPLSIVSKIADQEKALIGTTFLAPYVGGGKVRLRLSGIIYELTVPDCREGWGIFEVKGAAKAIWQKSAPLSMIRSYLQLFPQIRLIMIDRFSDERWWAISAGAGTQRLQLDGPVPVQLTQRSSQFETFYCRFDGNYFWFDSADRKRDPKIARELRDALSRNLKPDELQCKGSVPQERLVYKMLYMKQNEVRELEENAVQDTGRRITRALSHAGARLDSFWQEGNDAASVRFQLDGRTHVVQVRASDLSIVSAGICLSGKDGDFDLSSLVGVLREADNEYRYY